jgi:hypothetical protein
MSAGRPVRLAVVTTVCRLSFESVTSVNGIEHSQHLMSCDFNMCNYMHAQECGCQLRGLQCNVMACSPTRSASNQSYSQAKQCKQESMPCASGTLPCQVCKCQRL